MNKKKLKKILLLLVSLIVISLIMPSCQMQPVKEIGSMDELRKALKNYPDILLPDLSGYQMDSNNTSYKVTQWIVDRNVLNGYWIHGIENIPVVLSDGTEIEFEMFNIRCTSLEHYNDELNPPDILEPDTQRFGVDLIEWISDIQTESDETDISPTDSVSIGLQVPENTSVWTHFRRFDFNGCRYGITARVFAANGGDTSKDFLNERKEIDDGLLNVMKSILIQRPDLAELSTDSESTDGGEDQ